MKLKSIPKNATGREQSKTVKTNRSQDDKRNEKPCWRFSTVDRSGPFSWPKGQPEKLEIVEKLHQFDSMMWSEILGPPVIVKEYVLFLSALLVIIYSPALVKCAYCSTPLGIVINPSAIIASTYRTALQANISVLFLIM